MLEPVRVLIVDDESSIRLLLEGCVTDFYKEEREPFAVNSLDFADDAENFVMEDGRLPHVLFLDRNIRGVDGLRLLAGFRRGPGATVQVAVMTGEHHSVVEPLAKEFNSDFLAKPFSIDRVYSFLETSLAARKLPTALAAE